MFLKFHADFTEGIAKCQHLMSFINKTFKHAKELQREGKNKCFLWPMGVYSCCVTAAQRAPAQPQHLYLSEERGKQLEASVVTGCPRSGQGVLQTELYESGGGQAKQSSQHSAD